MFNCQIGSGELAPGSILPSNEELSERYSISRVTVRQAVKILMDKGLVVTVQGKGTFVATPTIGHNLNSVLTLSEVIICSGVDYGVKVSGFRRVIPPDQVSEFLQVEKGQKILCVDRQHFVGNIPIAYATIFVAPSIEYIFSEENVLKESMYELIEKHTSHKVGSAEQFIRARAADSTLVGSLDVQIGDSILTAERKTKSEENVPLLHTFFFYKANEHEFKINLSRSKDSMLLPTL